MMSKNAPYIILAEDDFRFAQRLEQELKQEFANGRIERVKSEHDFVTRLSEFASVRPDVLVMDVMLRWTVSGPNMPPAPEEVKRDGGYHRAGFRCIQRLASDEATKEIPCIIYTVLERGDLDQKFKDLSPASHVDYLRKESNHETLFKLIRQILKASN